jgi:HPt (histidine-containing phosphotransfer) domain-containing protein
MNASAQSDHDATNIAAALNRLWDRFVPEMRNRVNVLQAAADASERGDLTPEQREAAHAAAHKLAGTLGTFNLPRGTDLARKFEMLTADDAILTPQLAGNLLSIAAELQRIIDSRK